MLLTKHIEIKALKDRLNGVIIIMHCTLYCLSRIYRQYAQYTTDTQYSNIMDETSMKRLYDINKYVYI